MAVGTTIGDHGRGDFGHDWRSFPGGNGSGHEGWGDNNQGGQGMMPPGMGQGGQGYGHQGFDQDGGGFGQGYGWPQAPGATPAPVPSQSTSPQALIQ
jgi:hypothetical protein